MVVEPDSIIKGIWPQLDIIFIGPVDGYVEHHGLSHVLNGFNGMLSWAILMVDTNPRDGVGLIGFQHSVGAL